MQLDDDVVAAFKLPMPSNGLVELIEVVTHIYGEDLSMQQHGGYLVLSTNLDGAQDLP